MSNQRILAAYRNALRATKIAFGNDVYALNESRNKIKSEMSLPISTSNPKMNLQQRVELLEKVSVFLKKNIVQGVKNGVQDGKDKYTLRIHKETELGDNKDIKNNQNTISSSIGIANGGGCCGGGEVLLKQKK